MKQPGQPEDEIFEHALQLTGEERDRYLLQSVGDADRARIERLLLSSEEAGDFLNQPAATIGRTLAITTGMVPVSERPGDKIGPYTIREQIGEGGCGVVYVAEQETPVRRRVALKIIKLGMDTKEVVARFEAERQALALMDHPNIAKVFDGGATENGRPYFVMELVRGIKITDYCDRNNLSTEERLKLFMKACSAVQHAHQKGVIHRDIKPSNVLVTLHDGVPVPKVIDFGIAKATNNQRLTDKTIYTALEQFIGTPAYMSPEQAEMSGLDIDTRSDIYSLGVLLYELLTGRTPFDGATLIRAGLDEMRRIIREQEPTRPSTRIKTIGDAELTSIANRRGTQPPKLINLIRGDLDWIVLKTLEKDRTRRYETANALAVDLTRYLENEPVAARSPSRAYRLHKLVRRNRLAVSSICAVIAALLVGLSVTTWLLLNESYDRRRAAAAATAEERLRIETRLSELSREARDAENRGNLEQAEAALRLKLAAQTNLFGNSDSNLLFSLGDLARVINAQARQANPANGQNRAMELAQAENMLRPVLAPSQVQPQAYDDPRAAEVMHYLGDTLTLEYKFAEAEIWQRKALAIKAKWLGSQNPDLFYTVLALSHALQGQKKTAELRTLYTETAPVWRAAAEQGNGYAISGLARMYALGLGLLPLVYDELRKLAAHKMANEMPGQTLQATALVHEAWLKLVSADQHTWQNRTHFFCAAAEAMRRILIDVARRKRALRHGGGQHQLSIDEVDVAAETKTDELLAVHDVLDKLAARDQQKAALVKLRYFAGLSFEEAAEVLNISQPTAKRWWAYSRAWLFDQIKSQKH